VIVEPSGYIVTNAHVVERARQIQIYLAKPGGDEIPGKSILGARPNRVEAQLLGIDEETDLAVLKIDCGEELPTLPMGDSDDLKPGEMVLAVGSPLGLGNSVTMGVISASARQLKPEDSMIYVQTDAPINPGNSGGALINTRGELVGINTLIFSQSGGSEGIGFAAPSNIVRHVFEHIRKYGRVRRGEIGVTTQNLTPELAQGLNLTKNWGVILADVEPGGPGHKAGLKVGDIVLSLDGKTMENGRQFDVNVYQRLAGATVRLEILRGDIRLNPVVDVRERRDEKEQFLYLVKPEQNLVPELGILGVDVDVEVSRMLALPRKLGGIVVAARTAETHGRERGFLPGDVIHEVNGTEVTNLDSLRKVVQNLEPRMPAVIQVQRGARLLYLTLELN
jgi:serine protease Do